ncbi:LPXTG cell wall anchor domain-containing protein [Cellulomonas dongxiuzhuiae]|uniref:LPXTG cell wall anchor domain-containing protein n=1 Tax=Cellulomonas dongxiuzhuiae TaxID=2819979 RepID=UPI001AAF491A|nr:LPXTG cell wall anchor domain-containing protein [Cellulomonas dongxiuzhuiae]MBO3095637.1 LPXTG cell wall anchor domain-containing protein [Cellulomonas dongxiuzhuiae]
MDVSRQNQLLAHEKRRERLRRLLVLLTGLLLAATGVLAPVGEVAGAPRFDIRCDELIDGIDGIAGDDDLPGGKNVPAGHKERIPDYTYENASEAFRDRAAPTQAELDALQGDYRDFPAGSEDRMLRRWKVYEGPWDWERWRNTYIPNQANDARGDGFHRNVGRRLQLGGPEWMCEDTKLWNEKQLGYERRYDSVNRTKQLAMELKSGGSPLKLEQLRADQALMRGSGWKVYYVFSQEPLRGQVRLMDQHGIRYVVLESTARLQNPPAKPANTSLNPDPNKPTGGAAKDLAARSGRTAADAREARRLADDFDDDQRRQGFGARRPGGIDWTSLELHYVSDDPQTKDFGYAFSAAELPDDGEAEPGFGGEAALDLSSDALFTWLALDQSQFWVNLNPDSPESIIDPQFATTDAGRVLLQADLRFKETQYEYMDPETEHGKAFWDSMERTSEGLICHGSYRMWVEPKPATVREDGDQLYILDAPLAARYEPMDIDWRPPGQEEDFCEDAPQDIVDRNTRRIADTFAPLLEQRVNSAPEYADLRRVYTSRVAAQWLEERDAERPGAFHDVIGSGDVSPWPARTAWDPQDVFDEYVQQLSTPLFRYEWTFGDIEYWMDIVGGVTLPDTPREAMPAEQFQQEHPTLPTTVQSSVHDAVSVPLAAPAGNALGTFAEDTESMAWLGGGPIVQLAPEPTDPPDPGPTDPGPTDPGPTDPGPTDPGPTDPGPGPGDPGTPPGGRADGPAGPRGGSPREVVAWGGGTLPRTGFSEPWIVPTALGLILAGGALLVLRHRWTRRP